MANASPPPPPASLPSLGYPQLHQHLETLAKFSRLSVWIGAAAAAIIFAVGVGSGSDAVAASSLVTAVAIGATTFIGYLWAMVAIGAIRVLIDIEAAIRSSK